MVNLQEPKRCNTPSQYILTRPQRSRRSTPMSPRHNSKNYKSSRSRLSISSNSCFSTSSMSLNGLSRPRSQLGQFSHLSRTRKTSTKIRHTRLRPCEAVVAASILRSRLLQSTNTMVSDSSRHRPYTTKALRIADVVPCSPWWKTRMTCRHRRPCTSAMPAPCLTLTKRALTVTATTAQRHSALHQGREEIHFPTATICSLSNMSPITTHLDNLLNDGTLTLACQHRAQVVPYLVMLWCRPH